MKYLLKLLLVIVSITIYPLYLWAAWRGPIEIVKGSWGSGQGQFYMYHSESGDVFPRNIGIDKIGRIFINDGENRRIQVFSKTGKLIQIINAPPEVRDSDTWPYDIYVHPEGALVAHFDGPQTYFLNTEGKIIKKVNQYGPAYPVSEGFVFYDTKTKYDLYSLDGTFIKSYTSKPSEIDKNSDGRLKDLSIPQNQFKTIKSSDSRHDARAETMEEYGELIVAPNGDVYTWKQTPAAYSIQKWLWSDEGKLPLPPNSK